MACMHDVHVLPVTCSSCMECNNSLPIKLHDRTVGAGWVGCGDSVFELDATVIGVVTCGPCSGRLAAFSCRPAEICEGYHHPLWPQGLKRLRHQEVIIPNIPIRTTAYSHFESVLEVTWVVGWGHLKNVASSCLGPHGSLFSIFSL